MEKKYLKILNSVKNFETDDVLICVNLNDVLKSHNQICSEDDFVELCNFIDFCHQECSSSCYRLLAEIVCDLYLNLGIGYRDENRKIYIDKNLDLPATLSEEDLDVLNSNARILVVTIFEDTINNRF